MSGKPSVRLEARRLAEIRRKLSPDLITAPIRDMFTRVGETYLNEAKLRSPVDHGLMRSTLSRGANDSIFDIDKREPPLFIRVGTSHVSDEGFPYPLALDAGGEQLTYHYRSGGALGLSGQRTKDWFTGIKQLGSFLDKKRDIIARTAKKIKERWDS